MCCCIAQLRRDIRYHGFSGRGGNACVFTGIGNRKGVSHAAIFDYIIALGGVRRCIVAIVGQQGRCGGSAGLDNTFTVNITLLVNCKRVAAAAVTAAVANSKYNICVGIIVVFAE